MSLLQHIIRPLRQQTLCFFLSNTGNRCVPLSGVARRWISHMEVEDSQSFQKKLKATKVPVLAYFYKPQCGFCKTFEDKLSSVIKDSNIVDVLMKVNVEVGRDVAEKYHVEAVPTVLGFRSGKEVDKIVGNVNKEIIEKMVTNLK